MAYDRQKLFAELDRHVSVSPHIRLGQLASDLGVDRHTIENVIRDIRGTTFRQYRREILLGEAQGLLKEAFNMSIKQIAASFGYSAGSFSRFIRVNTGRTAPERLRKAARSTIILSPGLKQLVRGVLNGPRFPPTHENWTFPVDSNQCDWH